jgi:signal transduction histidine kinase
MAAGMAHEINNPLSGAANYLELVRDDLEAGDVPTAIRGVDRVAHGIDRASGVIREVLSFSAPGGGEGLREALDLRPLIARSAEFVRNQSRFAGVEIRLDLGEEPLVVEGNPVTLGQVFLNLLLNGVEAQARDPANAYVEIRAEASSENLVLMVEDRGPGIAPEVRESLFEPFVSTKGSTGLGLAVCRRIVREHDGSLEAENGAVGARFRMTLPARRSGPLSEGGTR